MLRDGDEVLQLSQCESDGHGAVIVPLVSAEDRGGVSRG